METFRSPQRINELSGTVGQGNRRVPGTQQLPWPTLAYGVLLAESPLCNHQSADFLGIGSDHRPDHVYDLDRRHVDDNAQ
jgi:hypothetical protein